MHILFIDSAITSGLGKLEGELIALVSAGAAPASQLSDDGSSRKEQEEIDRATDSKADVEGASGSDDKMQHTHPRGANPSLTVNLNVDSSSDPDKLEKQLKLLRQYNVI